MGLFFRTAFAWTLFLSLMLACLPLQARLLPGINTSSSYEEQSLDAQKPEPDYSLEGRPIRQIHVQTEDIFETDTPRENTLLFRLGNLLHIKTREQTIRSQLIFKPGDPLDFRVLEESERLLRNRTYLFDADIEARKQSDGSVDVNVRTRDVWSLQPGFSYGRAGGENTGGFDLEELNLLGTGSHLIATVHQEVDRSVKKLAYQNPNLGGSWWDFSAAASNNSDGKSHSVALKRPFYAMDTRRAGFFSYDFVKQHNQRYDLGQKIDEYAVRTLNYETSIGWSPGFINGWTSRYSLGFKYHESQFSALAGTRDLPQDRKLAYPWVAWERRQDIHRKDHNLSHINRTEDVDLSWKFTAVLGYASPAFDSDRHSVLFGGTFRKGMIFRKQHTLFVSGSINGRYESEIWQNLLYHQQFNYYLRQSPNWLFYLAGGIDLSDNLDPDNQLQLGGDNGLRGYPLRYQTGSGRWLITAEQRYFSNWYPFRLLTVGAALFADFGRVFGDTDNSEPSLGTLSDVGLGLRLGQQRSGVGGVIHIDIAFPTNSQDNIDSVQLLVQTKSSF